jgi:hypothetical protein
MARDLVVRHFRQIVLWPFQLMPVRTGQVQRHWEVLEGLGADCPWSEVADEFCEDPREFQERHYREFVTFLPYTQRFLYGSSVGQEASRRDGGASIHTYRHRDIHAARITLEPGGEAWTFRVAHVDLSFFLDADVAMVAFEMHADDLPLDVAQDTLFRFGRAYPGFWEKSGEGGNCPHRVEWLDGSGRVLASSDFSARRKYLEFVARHRAPCIAEHWDYLLRPFVLEYPGQVGTLRYRQLEYYRMPFMAYLALDDPKQLTRADWVRLGLVTRPGGVEDLPYSAATLGDFESRYCDDRFWGRAGERASRDLRIVVTGQTMSMVGAHGDPFFAGLENGLLSQFRHQYFLLFLVAHFHKAAMLSISDELAVAMNRLVVGDTESVKAFKRTIRQMMEVFLRFTHRYWFCQISNQELAQSVFDRLQQHLGNQALYDEVRDEVMDMNGYLDSDSTRRQTNTVLRLTVVTILGLIGTVATGFLGMNLIAAAEEPLALRIGGFLAILIATFVITVFSISRSRRLADFLEALSDERVPWRSKARTLLRAFRR